jgi:ATPase subunit of ABC transporter with duplicated ATPase domains
VHGVHHVAAERPPSVLILDEPANCLDLDTLGALESALRADDGALLVGSHDVALFEAIGVERPPLMRAGDGARALPGRGA